MDTRRTWHPKPKLGPHQCPGDPRKDHQVTERGPSMGTSLSPIWGPANEGRTPEKQTEPLALWVYMYTLSSKIMVSLLTPFTVHLCDQSTHHLTPRAGRPSETPTAKGRKPVYSSKDSEPLSGIHEQKTLLKSRTASTEREKLAPSIGEIKYPDLALAGQAKMTSSHSQ